MLSDVQRDKLRAAFQADTLRVRSMATDGSIEWKPVEAVHRNEVPWEQVFAFELMGGEPLVVTGGHRVYTGDTAAVEASTLGRGQRVRALPSDKRVAGWGLEKRQFMYDLTVADNHNLVLHRSGVVVHNCPDKFYHFRPPEHEGDIGQYNRIFGQIWEDAELLEYLQRALDWFNMHPPNTAHNILNLTMLVQQRPDWRTAILWGAIVHACFALSLNWVADEFSLGPDVPVRVHLPDGRELDIPIGELWDICKGESA